MQTANGQFPYLKEKQWWSIVLFYGGILTAVFDATISVSQVVFPIYCMRNNSLTI